MATETPQEKPKDRYGFEHEVGQDSIQAELFKQQKEQVLQQQQEQARLKAEADAAAELKRQQLELKRAENEEKMKKLMGG